jgi:hypothetical protein
MKEFDDQLRYTQKGPKFTARKRKVDHGKKLERTKGVKK